jgi:hypothetical protein
MKFLFDAGTTSFFRCGDVGFMIAEKKKSPVGGGTIN